MDKKRQLGHTQICGIGTDRVRHPMPRQGWYTVRSVDGERPRLCTCIVIDVYSVEGFNIDVSLLLR